MYNGINATDWSDIGSILSTTSTVIAGAILAFSMEIMEFLVVTHTSSLTLSISGVFKVNVIQFYILHYFYYFCFVHFSMLLIFLFFYRKYVH